METILSPTPLSESGSNNADSCDEKYVNSQNKITKRKKRKCKNSPQAEENDSPMSEIRKMFAEIKSEQSRKYSSLNESMDKVVKQNQDIIKSVEFISAQYEDVKSRMVILEKENKKYQEKIKELENKIDYQEKGRLSTTIEIRNIPKQQNETYDTLTKVTKDLGSTLDIQPPLKCGDIRDIYRTKTAIVVDFLTAHRKNSVIMNLKEYNKKKKQQQQQQLNSQHIGLSGPPTPIYVSEFLTTKAKRLHYLARKLVKDRKIVGCWTAYGKVYIRADEGGPAIRIDEEEELLSYTK